MSDEEWVAVPGHEGLYEVSNQGRVRSVPRVSVHRNGRRRLVAGQVLRQVPVGKYLKVQIPTASGKRVTYWVHRLVLLAFRGQPPEGMQGCHGDGNGRNNRLTNLRWDTAGANQLDNVRAGTHHNAAKTECPRRHALIKTNVVGADGDRTCRACANERSAAYAQSRPFSIDKADERFRLLTESGRAVEVEEGMPQ